MVARPTLSLLTMLGSFAAIWVAAPAPPPRPHHSAQAASPPKRPELVELRRFARMDLTDIEPEELGPLRTALRSLDPLRTTELLAERRRLGREDESLDQSELWLGLMPKGVWPYRRNGAVAGWVVYERPFVPQPHPGTSEVGLTYIDARGVVRARDTFTSGHRRYLHEARLEPVTGFDGPVVRVEVVGFGGQDFVRLFFAVVEDRFIFVRVEEGDGSVSRHPYRYVHASAAPVLRRRGEEWEADLSSADRGRVLRALNWVGRVEPGFLRPRQQEYAATAVEPTRSVRARPGVAARLRQLADSGDPWERDAARLALELDTGL